MTLRYFDTCPSWRMTSTRLRRALDAVGRSDTAVRYESVETAEAAERLGFVGSPTVLIDGHDPFLTTGAAVGPACRLYPTPEGLQGSPTVEQLVEVLR